MANKQKHDLGLQKRKKNEKLNPERKSREQKVRERVRNYRELLDVDAMEIDRRNALKDMIISHNERPAVYKAKHGDIQLKQVKF